MNTRTPRHDGAVHTTGINEEESDQPGAMPREERHGQSRRGCKTKRRKRWGCGNGKGPRYECGSRESDMARGSGISG